MSIFSVSEHVSAEEAARFYGLRFAGKRAFCPYHDDGRHPSMSFRGKSFYCLAATPTESPIDLVGHLLGVDALSAHVRSNIQPSKYYTQIESVLSELTGLPDEESAVLIDAHEGVIDRLAKYKDIADTVRSPRKGLVLLLAARGAPRRGQAH